MNNISFSSHSLSHLAMTWCLFFLICFSLGYPTLNRYAPDTSATTAENPHASLVDTKQYASLVEKGFLKTPDSHWRYRVLVPYVAKPFYLLSKGNIGSWNPIFFGLLIANSLFIASAAVVLFIIGTAVTGQRTVGFISSLLLLTHFNISNLYLAGLVDSSELFLMILTAWLLLQKKWQALPIVAAIAVLARETAVAFTATLAASWFIIDVVKGEYQRSKIYTIIFYGVVSLVLGLGGLKLLHYAGASATGVPWPTESPDLGAAVISNGVWGLVTSKGMVYSFIWLLPLGLLGIRSIPKNWLWASAITSGVAIFLIVISDAGENAGRPLFDTAGPILLVAAAAYITKLLKLDDRTPGEHR